MEYICSFTLNIFIFPRRLPSSLSPIITISVKPVKVSPAAAAQSTMSQSSPKPSLTTPPTVAVKSQFEMTTPAQSTQSVKLLYFPLKGNNKSVYQNVRQQKDIGEVFIESQTFKVDTDGNIENLSRTDKVILHSGARNTTFPSDRERNISVNLRAVNISIGRIMLVWNLCQKEFLNSISNLEVCIANNIAKIKAYLRSKM